MEGKAPWQACSSIDLAKLPLPICVDSGFDFGSRLIDEFVAKSEGKLCGDYKEMANTIAKVGRQDTRMREC